MAEIRTIVSDFGGVLTTPLLHSFMAFQDQTGITTETLGKAMQAATEANGENPLFEMERGEITEDAFLAQLTERLEPLLGHPPEMHRFREIYFEALEPNAEMIDLMRELKDEGYRMAMLTNNVREWEPLWRSMLPVDEIFETVVDSGFVGCRKPESRIYELTLERISEPAETCLFIDDVLVNIEGARKAGLTRFTSRTTSRRSPRSARRWLRRLYRPESAAAISGRPRPGVDGGGGGRVPALPEQMAPEELELVSDKRLMDWAVVDVEVVDVRVGP